MLSKRFVGFASSIAVSLLATAALANPTSATLNQYELVKVGDPNNAAETTSGLGSVSSEFWIGKYQVTIGQYADFLGAVAAADPYGLYNSSMGSDQRIRGITQSGSSGSYSYAVVGPNGTNPLGAQSPGNRPITYISWFDAARYANWMSNGRPTRQQIVDQGLLPGQVTEDGAYALNGEATPSTAPVRNTVNPNTSAAPTFFIPSQNEWYKAAYYSPVKGGEGSPGYYAYGTQSDTAPGNGLNGSVVLANKDSPNQANYRASSLYALTGGSTDPGSSGNQNLLTDVGAFTDSYTHYGAFDMSGGTWEWTDLVTGGTNPELRGGAFRGTNVSSTAVFAEPAANQFDGYGFRLASPVPEPATLGLASGGVLWAWWCWAVRRRRQPPS